MSTESSSRVSGTLYEWSREADEWVPWERAAVQAPNSWSWPFTCEVSVLTYNVWCEPSFAIGRAFAIVSQLARLCPDIIGLQEVSTPTEDDAGAPGFRGRGFWDVLHENAFVRSEYVMSTIEEQSDVMFESQAPYGSVLLLRKSFITRVPRVEMWYYTLESRDYSNLLGVDLCDSHGRPWLTIATGQFEKDEGDPAYGRQSRQAQFADVIPGTLSSARYGNALFLGDLNVLSLDEAGPFTESGFVDVYNMARAGEPLGRSATVGPFGIVDPGMPRPRGPATALRRPDLILARGAWFSGSRAELVGNTPLRQGYSGENLVSERGRPLRVFPSSHLGVAATLVMVSQAGGSSASAEQGNTRKRARTR